LSKEIIINASKLESRAAILEDGQLAELHVEREPNVAGSIYKGRITNVLAGMDAAFAEIGLERNGFLCVDDIILRREEQEVLGVPAPSDKKHPSITQLVRPNQEVLLQVVRAPLGSKGARVTTRLALPGRYLVLMLHTEGPYVGVSRKITDEKERQRLRELGDSLRPEHHSLILRTEAEGKGLRDLRKELTFLTQLADRITEKARQVSAPSLLHQDLNMIFRVIRDSFGRQVSRVLIDDEEVYQNVLELVNMIAAPLRRRVMRYQDRVPIFTAFNIEAEIDRLLKRRVRLPSGGHITVDTTEALVAIDVNTGRYTGGAGLEETIVHTNLEAVQEIARQLRLRNLGGILVLDFIDMERAKHRQQVTEALSEALKRDRAKTKIHQISPLGLIEMTRKRTGENLMEMLTDPCPYCSGTAMVNEPLTTALRIERELAKSAATTRADVFLVRAHPRVTSVLLGPNGGYVAHLQQLAGKPIYLRAMEGHLEEYQVEGLTFGELAAQLRLPSVGNTVTVTVVDQDPSLGLEVQGLAEGYHVFIEAPGDITKPQVQVKLTQVTPSLARGELAAVELEQMAAAKKRTRRRRKAEQPAPAEAAPKRLEIPPIVKLALPAMPVLPPEIELEEAEEAAEALEPVVKRRRRRRKPGEAPEAAAAPVEEAAPPAAEPEVPSEERPRKRTRRGGRRHRRRPEAGEPGGEGVAAEAVPSLAPLPSPLPGGEGKEIGGEGQEGGGERQTPEEPVTPAQVEPAAGMLGEEAHPRKRTRRGGRRHRRRPASPEQGVLPEAAEPAAGPETRNEQVPRAAEPEPPVADAGSPEAPRPRRRTHRGGRKHRRPRVGQPELPEQAGG